MQHHTRSALMPACNHGLLPHTHTHRPRCIGQRCIGLLFHLDITRLLSSAEGQTRSS